MPNHEYFEKAGWLSSVFEGAIGWYRGREPTSMARELNILYSKILTTNTNLGMARGTQAYI